METKDYRLPEHNVTFNDVRAYVLGRLESRGISLMTRAYKLRPTAEGSQIYTFSSDQAASIPGNPSYQLFVRGNGKAFFDYNSGTLDGDITTSFRKLDLGITGKACGNLLCKTEFRNDCDEEWALRDKGNALVYDLKALANAGITAYVPKRYRDEPYTQTSCNGLRYIGATERERDPRYDDESRISSRRFIRTHKTYDLMDLEGRIDLVLDVFNRLRKQ